MDRRRYLSILVSGSVLLTAGCLNDDETFEPDVSETIQLGTADPVVLDDQPHVSAQVSEDFEYTATVRANSRVHDHIAQELGRKDLFGAGVFLGINRVTIDEIDGEVGDNEFRRAVPLATVVNQRYVYDEDGGLLTQPEPEALDTLLSHLPRTVTVTVESDSNEYVAVLPVVVHRYSVYSDTE